jgi:serine-type D-Ala-D-Ala carboxypeptidase (penicillin-binding protein 5/6)
MRHFYILWFCFLAFPVLAQEALTTPAREALIYDLSANTVLFEKNADELMPPSSMSKLMTAYAVFDYLKSGKLKLTDTLPVSQKAWATQGSKMFVDINTQVSIEDLLRGMIIQSGNDACIVLAEGISGSEESFAELLNRYGKKIGLKNSYFVNATGWPHPQHRMTARDLSVLAERLVVDFPEYLPYYRELDFTYHGIKQGNRNPLLYGFAGAEGLKTGHTEEAGYGLTASANRDGRRVILVINGLPSMQARADESRRLLEWAYREFKPVTLAKAQQEFARIPVWQGDAADIGVIARQDITALVNNAERFGSKATLRYQQPVSAPITQGQILGQLVIVTGNGRQMEFPLVADRDVAQAGFFARGWRGLRYFVFGD